MVQPRRYPPLARHIRSGMLLLAVGLAVWVGARWWLNCRSPHLEDAPPPSLEAIKEIQAFEQRRRTDSAQRAQTYQAQREQWQREREERQRRREVQEAEYAARRARWDAEKAERATARALQQARYDSIRRLRPEKLAPGTTIDLNTADTLLLQRIPGIGPAYARSIIAYRERLGGFVTLSQLSELDYLPKDLATWCHLSPTRSIRRLSINRATFKELVRHPYLTYEQVKAIVNRRQKMGNLRGWRDLGNSPHFTASDTLRLTPYIQF